MGCGTNIVPGFNESNKIKDPALEMKITSEIAASQSKIKAEKQIDEMGLDMRLGKVLNLDEELMKFDSVGYKSSLNPHVEVLVDKNGSNFQLHNKHPMRGKYAFMLEKGANKKALAVFKNFGRPKIVEWSFDRAHYNPVSGKIALRIKADTLKNGAVTHNDILRSAMHESWHDVDYPMGEEVYPEKSTIGQFDSPVAFSGNHKAFHTVFFKDGQNLGITLDEGKSSDGAVRNRYQQDAYIRDTTIWSEHDNNLSALVFYEQMLADPEKYETIKKLIFTVPPEKRRNMFRLIFRGGSYGKGKIPQLVSPITDADVLSTYGHSFLLYDENVTKAQHLPLPDQLIMDAETYGPDVLPDLSDIPQEINKIEEALKDSKEMAGMSTKRNEMYKEMLEEGKRLGQDVGLIYPAMDIIDAMTSGHAHTSGNLSGHGVEYYTQSKSGLTDGGFYHRMAETFAQLGTAWGSKDKRAWQYMEKYFPNLTTEFESIIEKYGRNKIQSFLE
jgi:hypothetical protein